MKEEEDVGSGSSERLAKLSRRRSRNWSHELLKTTSASSAAEGTTWESFLSYKEIIVILFAADGMKWFLRGGEDESCGS